MTNPCNADTWFAGFVLSCMGSTLLLTTCIIQCAAERIEKIDVREQRIDTKRYVNRMGLEEQSIRQRRGEPNLDF